MRVRRAITSPTELWRKSRCLRAWKPCCMTAAAWRAKPALRRSWQTHALVADSRPATPNTTMADGGTADADGGTIDADRHGAHGTALQVPNTTPADGGTMDADRHGAQGCAEWSRVAASGL